MGEGVSIIPLYFIRQEKYIQDLLAKGGVGVSEKSILSFQCRRSLERE